MEIHEVFGFDLLKQATRLLEIINCKQGRAIKADACIAMAFEEAASVTDYISFLSTADSILHCREDHSGFYKLYGLDLLRCIIDFYKELIINYRSSKQLKELELFTNSLTKVDEAILLLVQQ